MTKILPLSNLQRKGLPSKLNIKRDIFSLLIKKCKVL